MTKPVSCDTTTDSVIFLVDLDETLYHADRFDQDLAHQLERQIGLECRERYFAIEQELFKTLGYRDYLGAFQQYRVEHPYEHRLMSTSSYVLDYPFAKRLYPGAIDVLERFRGWGRTVILTDGDAVLQPRKLDRTGVFEAVEGRVLIYIHKEQARADIERLYPAKHYVVVDDKLRILSAFKRAWRDRVTTVFPRQGHSANDPKLLASYPSADRTVERIGDLLEYGLAAFLGSADMSHVLSPPQGLQREVIQ